MTPSSCRGSVRWTQRDSYSVVFWLFLQLLSSTLHLFLCQSLHWEPLTTPTKCVMKSDFSIRYYFDTMCETAESRLTSKNTTRCTDASLIGATEYDFQTKAVSRQMTTAKNPSFKVNFNFQAKTFLNMWKTNRCQKTRVLDLQYICGGGETWCCFASAVNVTRWRKNMLLSKTLNALPIK